ncbi:hypothetical protein Ciccas_012807, partial [Cichlidogyrus casuarinus]
MAPVGERWSIRDVRSRWWKCGRLAQVCLPGKWTLSFDCHPAIECGCRVCQCLGGGVSFNASGGVKFACATHTQDVREDPDFVAHFVDGRWQVGLWPGFCSSHYDQDPAFRVRDRRCDQSSMRQLHRRYLRQQCSGLEAKPPEPISLARVLGLKVFEKDQELRWGRDNALATPEFASWLSSVMSGSAKAKVSGHAELLVRRRLTIIAQTIEELELDASVTWVASAFNKADKGAEQLAAVRNGPRSSGRRKGWPGRVRVASVEEWRRGVVTDVLRDDVLEVEGMPRHVSHVRAAPEQPIAKDHGRAETPAPRRSQRTRAPPGYLADFECEEA